MAGWELGRPLPTTRPRLPNDRRGSPRPVPRRKPSVGRPVEKKTHLVVAAIDFGTTYSGYAYSFYADYKADPLKIYANQAWNAEGEGLVTLKAPTIVLFDKNDKFHSFGFEAERKYIDLAMKEQHVGWKYFRRFKMELNKRMNLRKDMKLNDDQNKPKPAREVFAASIEFLKNHLVTRIQQAVPNIAESDVFWVITVPAIWHDGARQFMVESARMAGIPETQLTLALEPECAAIFCKEQTVNMLRQTKSPGDLSSFQTGAQFMVVDLGGGTVDITVHEVDRGGNLVELMVPSGGPWGGTCVDRAFEKLLNGLFSRDVMKQFGSEYKEDELDLQRGFELKKRSFKQADDTFAMRFPSAVYDVSEGQNKVNFITSLKAGPYNNTIRKKSDKLIIEPRLIESLFKDSKDNVVAHLKELLKKPEMEKVTTLLLVGGFVESDVMSDAIKTAFPSKRIIIPEEAGLAVVKGAVMYGHNMDSISSRKMPYTLGISTAVPFDERFHPGHKKVIRRGQEKCEDVFNVFICKDTEVVRGKTTIEHVFNLPFGDNRIEIYRSPNKEPRFVSDEGCKSIAVLELGFWTMPTDKPAVITVQMVFGDTQIEVKAKEHGSHDWMPKTAKINFLRDG